MTAIKAISLWEPFASAMALGLKSNETRHWSLSYRGDLAICSARRNITADEQHAVRSIEAALRNVFTPVYGCILCVVELYACVPTSQFLDGQNPIPLHPLEAALGNYTRGRFAWMTRNLRLPATPIPVTGRQGLFEVSIDMNQFRKAA